MMAATPNHAADAKAIITSYGQQMDTQICSEQEKEEVA